MTAPEDINERLNVAGTRHAVELANALGAGHLHHASSVAVTGDYRGMFREDMFDEGQGQPSAYHRKHQLNEVEEQEQYVSRKPVSTMAKPACMNMTRKPAMSVQTMLMAILLWPTASITSGSARVRRVLDRDVLRGAGRGS